MSGNESHIASAARLRTIFGYTSGGIADPAEAQRVLRSKYGLGDRRTVDQAILFSGIDTRQQKVVFNGCGNLDYVPFSPHPWGPDYIPPFDDLTEDPISTVVDPGSIYFSPDMMDKWDEINARHQEEQVHIKVPALPVIFDSAAAIQLVKESPFLASSASDHTLSFAIICVFLILSILGLVYGRYLHIGKNHKHVFLRPEVVKTV